MHNCNRVHQTTTALVLLFFILIIAALNLVTSSRTFSDTENRMLQQAPHFNLEALLQGKFTAKYEVYLADQFCSRDFWIGVRSDCERLLGKNESNGVYLGKDGYLLQEFVQPDQNQLRNKLKAINTFAALMPGINKYLMLVPTAAQILSEKLPANAPVADQRVYLNQVRESLNRSITYVGLYDTLYARKSEDIYYKTDHHWTTRGAYYSYQTLCTDLGITAHDLDYFQVKTVTSSFLGSLYSKGGFRHLPPDTIELYLPKVTEGYTVNYYDYNQVSNSLYVMDNLQKKDKYTVFLNGNQSLVKITTNVKNNRKLLVVKDSYALSLIPFLTGHYQEIYLVDLRYYHDSLQQLIKSNRIQDMLMLYNANTFFEDASINNISS